MAPSQDLPKCYTEWSVARLQQECQERNLSTTGLKHELIETIIDNDIALRALQPVIEYNEDNDPDGSLKRAQDEKNREDKLRNWSGLNAAAAYYEERIESLKVEVAEKKREAILKYVVANARV